MANAKFVKTAAAVALGTSVVATAVAPSASAATTYKIKSGKLVNAETGKVIKGYKTYKSVLYKDGKKYTGTRSGKYYKNGVLSSGVYNNIKYKKGIKFTGLSTSDNKMYKNGKLLTGTKDGVKYKAGVKFTGVSTNGKYYKNGVLGTGTYKNVKYKNGVEFTGVSTNGKYYENGVVATGVKTVDGVVYVDGVKDEVAPIITAEDQTVAYDAKDVDVLAFAKVEDDSKEEVKVEATITFDGKEVKAIDTTQAGEYTVTYTAKDANGNEAEAKTIKVTVEETTEAIVKSVEVTNGTTVVVNFTKAIEKQLQNNGTDESKDYGISLETATFNSAKLSEDGKTLTLKTSTALNLDAATLQVPALLLKGETEGKDAKKTTKYVSTVTYKDTVAPTAISASSSIEKVSKTTADTVVVKFSEDVVKAGTIAYVNGKAVNVSQSATDELVLDIASLNLKANDAVEIKLTNVKDIAGNTIEPNPTTITTSVAAADSVAPTVEAVKVGEKTVAVTYNEEVTNNTAAEAFLSISGNKVMTAKSAVSTEDAKTVVYTFDDIKAETFKDGKYSAQLYLPKAAVADKAGNELAAEYTTSVIFLEDKAVPTVVSSELKDNKFVVKYSKNVTVASTVTATATYTNPVTGKVETKELPTSGVTDKDTVEFNAASLDADKTYTVVIKKDSAEDLALTPNKTAEYKTTVTTPKAEEVASEDKTAPVLDKTDENVNVKVEKTTDAYELTYKITDTESALDFASLRDVNNYTFAGKGLPVGTTITTDADDAKAKEANVTIHIPLSAVDTTVTGVLEVSGLKDVQGNMITGIVTSDTTKQITLKDSVAPTVVSATAVQTDKSVAADLSKGVEFTLAKDSQTTVINVAFSEEIILPEGTKVFAKVGTSAELVEYGTATVAGKVLTIVPKSGAGVMSDQDATFFLGTSNAALLTEVADKANNKLTIPTISVKAAK